MKRQRPSTTLFMLSSLDGKISTGATNEFDFDKDLPKMDGVKEGLPQYYDLEKKTDVYSLNSGKVLKKNGVNKRTSTIQKMDVSFLVVDNRPHLTDVGVDNLLRKSKKLFIITTNKKHPAFKRLSEKHVFILYYPRKIDFHHVFKTLYSVYGIKKMTIQTGGELNAVFLRAGLIDRLSLVIAPALIGGVETPSVIGGVSPTKHSDLQRIKTLKLKHIKKLKHSYIHAVYDIMN